MDKRVERGEHKWLEQRGHGVRFSGVSGDEGRGGGDKLDEDDHPSLTCLRGVTSRDRK